MTQSWKRSWTGSDCIALVAVIDGLSDSQTTRRYVQNASPHIGMCHELGEGALRENSTSPINRITSSHPHPDYPDIHIHASIKRKLHHEYFGSETLSSFLFRNLWSLSIKTIRIVRRSRLDPGGPSIDLTRVSKLEFNSPTSEHDPLEKPFSL